MIVSAGFSGREMWSAGDQGSLILKRFRVFFTIVIGKMILIEINATEEEAHAW
jgi:hypothetical protein